MKTKLDWALEHVANGFRVFPLGETSKRPRISKDDGGNGCHDATFDQEQIRLWWTLYPNANIGLAVGDGLVLIDADSYKGADLSDWHLPPTLTVRTAHGGLHYYYRYAGAPLPCVAEGVLTPHVCIKAEGGYGVGPGSIVDGKRYEWIDASEPIAELPERIAEMILGATAHPEPPQPGPAHNGHISAGDVGGYWLAKALARTGEGVGDVIGYWLAQQLLIEEKHGATKEVRGVLLDYAGQATVNFADPFSERDVERWIKSASRSRLVQSGERARSHQSGPERARSAHGDAQYEINEINEIKPQHDQVQGLNSLNSLNSYRYPALDEAAYYGLAGEIVKTIEPHTEADPVAILVQFLTAAGNVFGQHAFFQVEAAKHYPNLFVVVVGASSKGRKGTSWSQVRRMFEGVADDWLSDHLASGLSSGEGLIHTLRDNTEGEESMDGKKRQAAQTPLQRDKRLLVREGEFAAVLKVLMRDGNTLSAMLRQAWDGETLRVLTKNSPERASNTHVSVIGHITTDELVRYLSVTDAANGFGNRFLWLCAKRARLLPHGGDLKHETLELLRQKIRAVCSFVQQLEHRRLTWDAQAAGLWESEYGRLSEGAPGLIGALTGRAEAQVIRLASIYALLDQTVVIKAAHLTAAIALWDYADASVRYIFGDALGDPTADTILQALRNCSDGLTRTDISGILGRNKSAQEIERALSQLQKQQLASSIREIGDGGRSVDRWCAVRTPRVAGEAKASKTAETGAGDVHEHPPSDALPRDVASGPTRQHCDSCGVERGFDDGAHCNLCDWQVGSPVDDRDLGEWVEVTDDDIPAA